MSESTNVQKDLRNLRRDLSWAYQSIRQRRIAFLSTFAIVFASMIPWIWADGERISQATTVRSALVGEVPVQSLFDLLEAAQDARALWRLDAVGRYEDLSVVRAAAGVRFDLKPDGLVILSSQRPQDFDLARECVDFIVSSSVDRQDEAIE